jgi:monoamine oxidase
VASVYGARRPDVTDVIVLGAGLAGLSCARDLLRGGADVAVVEARDRVGGRVEQELLPDGRALQLGGEIVGVSLTAYLALAAELGLEVVPSFTAEEGEQAFDLADGVVLGEGWLDAADRASQARYEAELARIVATVDPDDPWSHPDARRLDALSLADLMRETGVTPRAWRRIEARHAGGAYWGVERHSVLGVARAAATADGHSPDDFDAWESLKLADGSGALPERLARDLEGRIRLAAPVRAIAAGRPCRVTLASGEELTANAVVCTIPVGPLRAIAIQGVSDARLASLHRQRPVVAGKVSIAFERSIWRGTGCDGLVEGERELGTTWVQGEGALSTLIRPEYYALLLAAPQAVRDELVTAMLRRVFGEAADEPQLRRWRFWGTDPWTQGYVTHWAPGDLTAVGPLHGTHEPPFYVAGSDQWVVGYMEGAVHTGRGAARAILG